ncbi:ABC transporter substrate-binding protein [Allokutzneria albata]|uniref:Iron complex transport system substrate-binding protein n=1 Tax=Allokutzneria albata TaxID=211114 RepID=A0A1G9XQR6_ALLAB|nr:iron-siderophore ABC transporter substrate-binding protein [Allokutzneria albata]SDM99179.1 iron complex transport system substrate-binding protein [Allokutzneria albata]
MRSKSTVTAAVVALALLLGACATGKPPGGQPAVAVGGSEFAKAAEESAKFGTDAAPGVFPRTIKHAMGSTALQKRPERVIVLDGGELDNVVALGVKPVGVAFTEGSPVMPGYLAGKAGDPANVGTVNTLKLEAIKALRPDLILGSRLRAEQLYPKLAEIAPTVFSLRPGFTWKENFRLNAAALDRTADADAQLADYTRRAKEIGARAEQRLGKRPTISMVRFMPGRIRLYAAKSFIGTILIDAGLPRPATQQVEDLAVEVSTEQIGKADADRIYTGSYGDPAKTQQADVLGGQVWKQLGAVKAGNVRPVSDETWFLGLGVMAANQVLTDLDGLL